MYRSQDLISHRSEGGKLRFGIYFCGVVNMWINSKITQICICSNVKNFCIVLHYFFFLFFGLVVICFGVLLFILHEMFPFFFVAGVLSSRRRRRRLRIRIWRLVSLTTRVWFEDE